MIEKYVKELKEHFYAIFRVIVGLLFAMHGASKFGIIGDGNIAGFAGAFGLPLWLGYIAALAELLGGLFILLGLYTRLGALLGGIVMLVALIRVHFPKGIDPSANGGELALLFLVSFLVLISYGAGKASLEKAMTNKEYF